MEENYANPFNPTTDLRFVTLKIYDVLGREASALVSERLKPGSYSVRWDAGNFPSGVNSVSYTHLTLPTNREV